MLFPATQVGYIFGIFNMTKQTENIMVLTQILSHFYKYAYVTEQQANQQIEQQITANQEQQIQWLSLRLKNLLIFLSTTNKQNTIDNKQIDLLLQKVYSNSQDQPFNNKYQQENYLEQLYKLAVVNINLPIQQQIQFNNVYLTKLEQSISNSVKNQQMQNEYILASLKIIQANILNYQGKGQQGIKILEQIIRQKSQIYSSQLKINIALAMLGSQDNGLQTYLQTGRVVEYPEEIFQQPQYQRKQTYYDIEKFMGQQQNIMTEFQKQLINVSKNDLKIRLSKIYQFLYQFDNQRIPCNKACCKYGQIDQLLKLQQQKLYDPNILIDSRQNKLVDSLIRTPQLLYETSLNNFNFDKIIEEQTNNQQQQIYNQEIDIENIYDYVQTSPQKQNVSKTYQIPQKLQEIYTQLIQEDDYQTPHQYKEEQRSLINLILAYQTKVQPFIQTQPLSRLIFFGQFINYQDNNLKFNCKFDQMQQILEYKQNEYAPMIQFENLEQPMLLYTYVLSILNQRIQWANKIAEIIKTVEDLNGCVCGSGLTIIQKMECVQQLQKQIIQHCCDEKSIQRFVDSLLLILPPPPLPSPELLYITIQSNPIIVEYLLGYKRLPDVTFMRQLILQYSNNKYTGTQKTQQPIIQQTESFIIQKQTLEAINYVSEAGHFWQADDLYCDTYKTAMISKIARSSQGQYDFYIEYNQWFTALKQQFQGHDGIIKYSCLDFLYQTYKQFVDYQLLHMLKVQLHISVSYYEQLIKLVSDKKQQANTERQQFRQQNIQQASDEIQGPISNSFVDFKNQNYQQDPLTFVTPYDIDNFILSLQTLDTLKSSIAYYSFEKRQIISSQDQQQIFQSYQPNISQQQTYLQLGSQLLDQLPNINVGQLVQYINDQNKYDQKQQDLQQLIVQQVQQFLPDFQEVTQIKYNNITKKDNRKNKNNKKSQQSQQQSQNSIQQQINNSSKKIAEFIMDDVEEISTYIGKYSYCGFYFINSQLTKQFNTRLNRILDTLTSSQQLANNQQKLSQTPKVSQIVNNIVQQKQLILSFDYQQEILQFRYLLGSFYVMNDFDITKVLNSTQFQDMIRFAITTQQDIALIEILAFLNGIQTQAEQIQMFIQQTKYISAPSASLFIRKQIFDDAEYYTKIGFYYQDQTDLKLSGKTYQDPNKLQPLISMKDQLSIDYRLWYNKIIINPYEIVESLMSSQLEVQKQKIGQFINIDLASSYLNHQKIYIQDTILRYPCALYEAILNNDNNSLYCLILTHDFIEQNLLQAVNFAFYAHNAQAIEILLGLKPPMFTNQTSLDQLQQLYRRQLSLPQFNDRTIESQLQYELYKRLHTLILNSSVFIGVRTQDIQQQMKIYRPPQFYDHAQQLQYIQSMIKEHDNMITQLKLATDNQQQLKIKLEQQINVEAPQKEIKLTNESIQQALNAEEILSTKISLYQKVIEQYTKHYLFKSQEQMRKFFEVQNKVRNMIEQNYQMQFTLIFQALINSQKCYDQQCLQCRIRKQSLKQYENRIQIPQRCQQEYQLYQQYIYFNKIFDQSQEQAVLETFIQNGQIRRLYELMNTFKYIKEKENQTTDFVILQAPQTQKLDQLTNLMQISINHQLYQNYQQIYFINQSTTLTIAAQTASNYIQYYADQVTNKLISVQIDQYVNFTDGFGYTALHHSICNLLRQGQVIINMYQQAPENMKSCEKNPQLKHQYTIFHQIYNCVKSLLQIDKVNIGINNNENIGIKDRIIAFLISNKLIQTNSPELQQVFNIIYQEINQKDSKYQCEEIYMELLFQLFVCFSDNHFRQQRSDSKSKNETKRLQIAYTNKEQLNMQQRKQKIISSIQNQQGQFFQNLNTQIQQNKLQLSWNLNIDKNIIDKYQDDIQYGPTYQLILISMTELIKLILDNEKIQIQTLVAYMKEHKVQQSKLQYLVPNNNNWLGYSFSEDIEQKEQKKIKSEEFTQPQQEKGIKVFPFFDFVDQERNQQPIDKQYQATNRFIKADNKAFISEGQQEPAKVEQSLEEIQYNNYSKRFKFQQENDIKPGFFSQQQIQQKSRKFDAQQLSHYLSSLKTLQKSTESVSLIYRIGYRINSQYQYNTQMVSIQVLVNDKAIIPRFQLAKQRYFDYDEYQTKYKYLLPREQTIATTDDILTIRKMLLKYINRFKHYLSGWCITLQQLVEYYNLAYSLDIEQQNQPILSNLISKNLQFECYKNQFNPLQMRELYKHNEVSLLEKIICNTDQDLIELQTESIQSIDDYSTQIKQTDERKSQQEGFTVVSDQSIIQ